MSSESCRNSISVIRVARFGPATRIAGPGDLVPTAVESDEGPAAGANSTFGRATSGSGLGATPVFQGEFPRIR